MGEEFILAFRLGSQFDGGMPSDSVFDSHFYHNYRIQGRKVLFTTKTKISEDKKNKIGQIILLAKDSNEALIADSVRFETYEDAAEQGYKVPSQWKYEEKLDIKQQNEYYLFGLSNINPLTEKDLEQYVNINTAKPLLDSLNGNNPRVYVKLRKN